MFMHLDAGNKHDVIADMDRIWVQFVKDHDCLIGNAEETVIALVLL